MLNSLPKPLRLLGFFAALLICASAQAQEPLAEAGYGLAMHGQALHSAQDPHYRYANPDAPKGGAIKMSAIGTFDTLNPYAIKGKAALGLNLVYDRLMTRNWDEPFTMYPLIAQSYEMPEDRSWIRFTLNPKARFHDGTPITAQDVLFSFETLKNHGRPNMRKVYKLVSSAKQESENTVYFEFTKEHDRETALIIAMMPVLSKSYWNSRNFEETVLENINLNGPYRIKGFEPGRYITYQRVDEYWAKDLTPNVGHHNFDEITYEYYRDDTVALQAFKAGDLDLRRENDLRKWLDSYDFPALESGKVIKEDLSHGRPERTRALIFNTRNDIFGNIKTREALSLLLDREQINALLFNGRAQLINSYFPNSEFEAPATPETAPIDTRQRLRRASALLKEAGWAVENGIQIKNGQALSFELLLQHPKDEKIALHYQQALKRLGIEMQIRVADSAGFLRRLMAYDYDMVLHHWQSSLSPGTEQVLYWGCESPQNPSRFNYAGICDPSIDALAKTVAQTQTRKELVETMRKLDTKLLDGYYIIPLFYKGVDFVSHKNTLKRPQEIPLYGMVLESWWMDEDKPAQTD